MIESDSSSIKKIADSIKGKDEIETVEKIYKYVRDTLTYDNSLKQAWTGALEAAKTKKGVCSDYADLFVALCRAKGIPARYLSGATIENGTSRTGHAWVDVYFSKYGWVPFDPTFGDSVYSGASEKYMPNVYITLGTNRESDGGMYWGGTVESSRSFSFSNIKDNNSIEERIKNRPFKEFLAQPQTNQDFRRYKNYFDKIFKEKIKNSEEQKLLTTLLEKSFSPMPLTPEESAIISETLLSLDKSIKKKNDFDGYYTIRQVMRIARLRLSFEKNENQNLSAPLKKEEAKPSASNSLEKKI